MVVNLDATTIQQRIEFLNSYRVALLRFWKEPAGSRAELRSQLNRNLAMARVVLDDVGQHRTMSLRETPRFDPLEMMFEDGYSEECIPTLSDMLDRAVGVYEHMAKGIDLRPRRRRETVDLEGALERALRLYFKRKKPADEREVQDGVEVVLGVLGMGYHRDKECVVVGERSFKPDFTVPDLELAVEVKLASETHRPSDIQEEIAADCAAYSTKWSRVLFVVYDLGVIDNPHKFRKENLKCLGVSVVVVKH